MHIPVSLYTATQDNGIRFNQLCKEDAGEYVTVSDEEFEKIKTEKDRAIQILHFTDLDSIRPSYYEKTYHAEPDAGGDKAFALLRQAMLDERKMAIGKAVLGQKETKNKPKRTRKKASNA